MDIRPKKFRPMRDPVLASEADGAEIKAGDVVTTFRGERVTFRLILPPHHASSEGHVVVQDENGRETKYYPSVINARIVERAKAKR